MLVYKNFLQFFLILFIFLFFVSDSSHGVAKLKGTRHRIKKTPLYGKELFEFFKSKTKKKAKRFKIGAQKIYEKELEGKKITKKKKVSARFKGVLGWKRGLKEIEKERVAGSESITKKIREQVEKSVADFLKKEEMQRLYKELDDIIEESKRSGGPKTDDDALALRRKLNVIAAKVVLVDASDRGDLETFKSYADIFVKGLDEDQAEKEIKNINNYITSSRHQKVLREILKKHIEGAEKRRERYRYVGDSDIKKWMLKDVEKAKKLEVREEDLNLIKKRNNLIRDIDKAEKELKLKEENIKKINQEIDFLKIQSESAGERADQDVFFKIGDMIDDEEEKLKVAKEEKEEGKRNVFVLNKKLDEVKKKVFEAGLSKETAKDLNVIKLKLEDLGPGGYADAKKILEILSSRLRIDPKISIKDKSEILKLYFDDSKYPGDAEREVASDIRKKVDLAFKTIEGKRKYVEEFKSPKEIRKYIKNREKEIKIRVVEKKGSEEEIKSLGLMLSKSENRFRNYENKLNKLNLELREYAKKITGLSDALKKKEEMEKTIKNVEERVREFYENLEIAKTKKEKTEINEQIKSREEMLNKFYDEYSDFIKKSGIEKHEELKKLVSVQKKKVEEEKKEIALIKETQDDTRFQIEVREKEIEDLKEEIKDARFYLKKK